MAESFDDLQNKYSNIVENSNSSLKSKETLETLYDFDELKMYFGEDYWVTDRICIKQPTIGQILDYGDVKFYSMINTICANTTTFRLDLWKNGVDWNKLSDFTLFSSIIKGYTPENTYLIFGDLNLSWFEVIPNEETKSNILVYIPRDKTGHVLPFDYKNPIIIDELIYMKMIKYLRTMFNINPKVERAKNKATKEAIIWEDEMNLKKEAEKKKDKGYTSSFLLPLISSMVNHPGFKYKLQELKEVGIVQFMDSVKRLQLYENTTALMSGVYSGMLDSSKMNLSKELNWLKDLNE